MLAKGRRRLSNGSALIDLHRADVDTDEDKDINADTPAQARASDKQASMLSKPLARRKSSAGNTLMAPQAQYVSSVDQAKLAHMYTTIIKMSSENKINAKNSWSLDLIDHMEELLDDDPTASANDRGNQQINFQKASCTLDASVKIYSCRVDDTWSSSYRILENLNRTDKEEPKQAKVGTKTTSAKLCLVKTLEKDPSNLNMSKLDTECGIDPMFHKMAQTFDESGAKGMLLVNLRIRNGCQIVFDESNTQTSAPELKNAFLDMADVIESLNLQDDYLASAKICPSLDVLRQQIHGNDWCSTEVHEALRKLSGIPLPAQTKSMEFKLDEPQPEVGQNVEDEAHMGGWDDADDYEGTTQLEESRGEAHLQVSSAEIEVEVASEAIAAGSQKAISETVADLGNQIADSAESGQCILDDVDTEDTMSSAAMDWNTVFADDRSNAQVSQARRRASMMYVEQVCAQGGSESDYYLFDPNKIRDLVDGGNNLWAGASHWKLLGRRKTANVNTVGKENADPDGEIHGKKSHGRKRKVGFTLNFDDNLLAEELFAPPKNKRADPRKMTTASMTKAMKTAREGGLNLPQDAELEVWDLCRLFTMENKIVWKFGPIPEESKTCRRKHAAWKGFKDDEWITASINDIPLPTAATDGCVQDDFRAMELAPADDDEGHWDGGDDGDDELPPSIANSHPAGLIYSGSNLLQASRVVEKLDIKFATTAKRVDVRKLKHNIWDHLEQNLPSHTEPDTPTSSSATDSIAKTDEGLSFRQLLHDVSEEQTQEGVTLPFYFICLLHLANEKNLRIEDQGDLADLKIF